MQQNKALAERKDQIWKYQIWLFVVEGVVNKPEAILGTSMNENTG